MFSKKKSAIFSRHEKSCCLMYKRCSFSSTNPSLPVQIFGLCSTAFIRRISFRKKCLVRVILFSKWRKSLKMMPFRRCCLIECWKMFFFFINLVWMRQMRMPKRTLLVRSSSDGQLTVRPVYKHDSPRPHARTDLLQQSSKSSSKNSSNYGACREQHNPSNSCINQSTPFAYSSYWSPAVSEIDPVEWHVRPPVTTNGLHRRMQLYRLVFLFIQMSLLMTQNTMVILHTRGCILLIAFSSASFLAAIFAPLIFRRVPDQFLLFFSSLSALFYSLITWNFLGLYVALPGAVLAGWSAGLIAVKQTVVALHLGLRWGQLKNRKVLFCLLSPFYFILSIRYVQHMA